MSTYRVPKCGRHFVKFDDVTIYPVLVVARTDTEHTLCRSLVFNQSATNTQSFLLNSSKFDVSAVSAVSAMIYLVT